MDRNELVLRDHLVFVDDQAFAHKREATLDLIRKLGGATTPFCKPTITLWVTGTASQCDTINWSCGNERAYEKYRFKPVVIKVSPVDVSSS